MQTLWVVRFSNYVDLIKALSLLPSTDIDVLEASHGLDYSFLIFATSLYNDSVNSFSEYCSKSKDQIKLVSIQDPHKDLISVYTGIGLKSFSNETQLLAIETKDLSEAIVCVDLGLKNGMKCLEFKRSKSLLLNNLILFLGESMHKDLIRLPSHIRGDWIDITSDNIKSVLLSAF